MTVAKEKKAGNPRMKEVSDLVHKIKGDKGYYETLYNALEQYDEHKDHIHSPKSESIEEKAQAVTSTKTPSASVKPLAGSCPDCGDNLEQVYTEYTDKRGHTWKHGEPLEQLKKQEQELASHENDDGDDDW